MEQVNTELGGLDILVNNAGVLQDRTIKKMRLEDWETVLRVNFEGQEQANAFAEAFGGILLA